MNRIVNYFFQTNGLSYLLMAMVVVIMVYFQALNALDNWIYAQFVQFQQPNSVESPVAIIAIDQQTRQQLQQSNPSRHYYAELIQGLNNQTLGIVLDLSNPDINPKLADLQQISALDTKNGDLSTQLVQLEAFIQQITNIRTRLPTDQAKLKNFVEFYTQSQILNRITHFINQVSTQTQSVITEIDANSALASRLNQHPQILLSIPAIRQDAAELKTDVIYPELDVLQLNNIRQYFALNNTPQPIAVKQLRLPLAEFIEAVPAAGMMIKARDKHYLQPLVMQHADAYYPSLALLMSAYALATPIDKIEVHLGEGVQLDERRFNTDKQLQIYPFFYQQADFPIYSLSDVLNQSVSLAAHPILLLGITESPLADYQPSPLGDMPQVIHLAHTLTSLLNQDYLYQPHWHLSVQILLVLAILSYVVLLLKRLKTYTGFMLTIGLLGLLISLNWALLYNGWAIFLSLPIVLLIIGYCALLLQKFMLHYQDAFRLHPDAVESNRLLGLAFQGQGHLDMAFEKFRLCPPDEQLLGILYNLALDYETKRQFTGASAVYRYLLSHSTGFRDVEKRLARLQRWQPPRLLGGKGIKTNQASQLLDDSSGKRTLGRYQVERELGKGAMGLVYLGRDPKLDRLVAIKTLALSQEFEGEELQEATQRFFREASAAGRLKHPHIVTIYDAGEEQDLAYISMEFFKGGNLLAYCKSDNLLPINTVMEITIKVAEALDYAFSQGVVHRDIKPANIMYNPASGNIKITDFGIARITDATKTRTGVILGTPSYMSPEQLAGQAIDGRTDIFSLGIMLYQLLTAKLPFTAENIASLMYKIANEPHAPLHLSRADIPACLQHIVDKMLAKTVEQRFQTGIELAHALRDCQQEMHHHAPAQSAFTPPATQPSAKGH